MATAIVSKNKLDVTVRALKYYLIKLNEIVNSKYAMFFSVDGEKLYHGYSTEGGRSAQQCTGGCPCGSNKGHPNDIQELCIAMLRTQGVTDPLIAAYVSGQYSTYLMCLLTLWVPYGPNFKVFTR